MSSMVVTGARIAATSGVYSANVLEPGMVCGNRDQNVELTGIRA